MQAAVMLYSRAGQYGLQIKKLHLDSFKSTQVYYINARTLQQNQIPHPFFTTNINIDIAKQYCWDDYWYSDKILTQ